MPLPKHTFGQGAARLHYSSWTRALHRPLLNISTHRSNRQSRYFLVPVWALRKTSRVEQLAGGHALTHETLLWLQLYSKRCDILESTFIYTFRYLEDRPYIPQ